jgi:hypothetical protein
MEQHCAHTIVKQLSSNIAILSSTTPLSEKSNQHIVRYVIDKKIKVKSTLKKERTQKGDIQRVSVVGRSPGPAAAPVRASRGSVAPPPVAAPASGLSGSGSGSMAVVLATVSA